jgi:hypothetical protein
MNFLAPLFALGRREFAKSFLDDSHDPVSGEGDAILLLFRFCHLAPIIAKKGVGLLSF